MKYEIRNRFTGDVQVTAEIDCDEDAREAVKLGLAVKWAVKNGANLGGANLGGAYLGDANLGGADLRGADLGGAYLYGADLGGADLVGADLRGANLYGADLGGADLVSADLRGANLYGADLGGADLRGADLGGATYGTGIPMTVEPIQLLGLRWPILFLDHHIKIGCELHSIDEWERFTDEQINRMDHGALKFWRQHRDMILAMARAHEPGEES